MFTSRSYCTGISLASKKDKLLDSAQRFVLKGQLDSAIRHYREIVLLDPKEVRHRQKLAELLVKDNRKDEAVAEYEEIGKEYAQNCYFLKAIAVYKQIQRLSPGKAVSLTIASLNHKQGLIGNAMTEYGQVVAQLEREGLTTEAVKVLEQMLEVDPEHAATRLKYAELLLASGARDESRRAFAALLASLRKGGHGAAAQKVADQMAGLFPAQDDEELKFIAAQIAAGDPDGAVAVLQERLKQDGANLEAWQLLCEAERAKGDMVALRLAYHQMLILFPENLEVMEGAIRSNMQAGDFRRVTPLLESYLQNFAGHGTPIPAEELFLSLPADVARDAKVKRELKRIYEAAGVAHKLSGVKHLGVQSSSVSSEPSTTQAPPAEIPPSVPKAKPASRRAAEPAPASSESPAAGQWPDALDEVVTPEAPASAPAKLPTTAPAEASSTWEEEIELDLDDGFAHDLLWAAHEAASPAGSSPVHFQEATAADQEVTAAALEDAPLASACFVPDDEPQGALPLDLDEDGPLEFALYQEHQSDDLSGQQQNEESVALPPRQRLDWQDIFPQPAGAEQPALDLEELESHYDLGIGYKEMGLYKDAIKEFSVAAGNPRRRLDCLTLQAICYREKGETAKAEELLQRGRDLGALSAVERVSLSYELAFLYEMTGAVDEAILLYREVWDVDPGFHDVGRRLAALAGEEPLDIIDLDLEEES
jgi:tetratricopeptide (TPR) repeat protein